jgi:23S rRNA pseudouridine2605 synthase
VKERVFPVGRLDFHTSGVLLLTNDGDLAQALLHPTRAVPKTYSAKLQGQVDERGLEMLRSGVVLDDGEKTAPATVHLMRGSEANQHTLLEITISEGKNRQIHRMGEAINRPVMRLTRIAFAGLTIEGLRAGQTRPLKPLELSELKQKYMHTNKVGYGRGAMNRSEVLEVDDNRPQQEANAGGLRDAQVASPSRAERDGSARRDGRGALPRRDERGVQPRRDERGVQPRRDGRGALPRRGERGVQPRRDERGVQPRRDERGVQPRRDERGVQPRRDANAVMPPRRQPRRWADDVQPQHPTVDANRRRTGKGAFDPRRTTTGAADPRRTATGPRRARGDDAQPRRTTTGAADPRRTATGPRRARGDDAQPRRTTTGAVDPRRTATGPRRARGDDAQPRRTTPDAVDPRRKAAGPRRMQTADRVPPRHTTTQAESTPKRGATGARGQRSRRGRNG